MTNEKLKAIYEYRATHCAACDVEMKPIPFTDNRYVSIRFCDKPGCKEQEEQYYNCFW